MELYKLSLLALLLTTSLVNGAELTYDTIPVAQYSFSETAFNSKLNADATLKNLWDENDAEMFSLNGAKELKLLYPKCIDLQSLSDATVLSKIMMWKNYVMVDAKKYLTATSKNFQGAQVKVGTSLAAKDIQNTVTSMTKYDGTKFKYDQVKFDKLLNWLKNQKLNLIPNHLISLDKFASVWSGDALTGEAKCQLKYNNLDRVVDTEKYRDSICYQLGIPAAVYVEPNPPAKKGILCKGIVGELDFNVADNVDNKFRNLLSDEFIRRYIWRTKLDPKDPVIMKQWLMDEMIRNTQMVSIQANINTMNLLNTFQATGGTIPASGFEFMNTPSYNIELLNGMK